MLQSYSVNKIFNRIQPERWVDGAVIYQIYPRSFQDSNGDGVGDLHGITERLDYLHELGVTGIWISPFYPSPMADFGYDVADYCDIDPLFGSLADFKQLLRAAHKHNIKVMVDIVPSHTSDEHPWFKASKKSHHDAYSDWYIWRDPVGYKNDKPLPPNNWIDMFSGDSSWEWVPERQQFYLHSFHQKQPDLNWTNPHVREALKNVLRFWLKLGVDGFRVDAVPYMDKDPNFTDNPIDRNYNPEHDPPAWRFKRVNSQGWPKHYAYLDDLSSVLKERRFRRRPRFMVTEGYVERDSAIQNYLEYYRAMDPTVATPFIFEGIERPWGARNWQAFLRDFHSTLKEYNPESIPAYAFGNHDQSRLATRLGADRARAVAVMQLTLPGMTFVYNGEEIGMHDVAVPPSRVQDPQAIGSHGRDPERTPMQWSSEKAAGFTTGEPWLPVAHDYMKQNAEVQTKDPNSFLSLYRTLIHLRTKSSAFKKGSFELLEDTGSHILAYSRAFRGQKYTIVINFKDENNSLIIKKSGRIIVSSLDAETDEAIDGVLRLKAHEAVVIQH